MTGQNMPTDTDDTAQAKPTTRGLRIAFMASVALNLLLMGLIAGAIARGPGMRHSMMGPDAGFGPLTDSLSREDRRALRERYEALRPDYRAERGKMRDDFLALAQLLSAPVWDQDAAEAILARQGGRATARLQEGRRVFLDFLSDLSPPARLALGTHIRDAMSKRGEDEDDDHND